MAILIIHQGADWNQELYDQAIGRAIPDPSNPPEGMVASFAAPGENGGWRVVDIWESEADWESFRDGTLIPGIQEIQGPPSARRSASCTTRSLASGWPRRPLSAIRPSAD